MPFAFRTMKMFRFEVGGILEFRQALSLTESRRLQPLGALERERWGFIPAGPAGDSTVYLSGYCALLVLGCMKKVLPPKAIAFAAEERAVKLEEQQGRRPGKRQMRELKEQVEIELLAKAPIISDSVRIWIDTTRGLLVLDSASTKPVDAFLSIWSQLGNGLPPLMHIDVERPPSMCMTEWLASQDAPEYFTIDQQAELQSLSGSQATVRYLRCALDRGDVRQHLAEGKRCLQLALTHRGRVSFVLTDKLVLKSLRVIDGTDAPPEQVDMFEDERFAADFTIWSDNCTSLIDDLTDALGGMVTTTQEAA